MKQATISDFLLNKALEMSRERIERLEVGQGHIEFYTPCASGKHKEHVVTVKDGKATCDCHAWGFCKHILASVGRSVAVAIQQCRWATEPEEIDEILSLHAPAIRQIPEPLKALARSEALASKRRLEVGNVGAAA